MKLTNNIIFKFILLFYSLFFVFKVDAKPTSMILIVGSFLITFLVFPIFIKFLKKSKDVQQIKEDGPTWHEKKAGTPTMGGLLFISITILATFCFIIYNFVINKSSLNQLKGVISLLFVIIGFGAIGFIDDFKKISLKQNLGLRARDKFALQLLVGLIYLVITPIQPWRSFHGLMLIAGSFIFCWIWIVGFSNAVNLTDGIDGLAGGTSLIVLSFYILLAIVKNNYPVLVVASALFGTIIAFLYFNFKPAKIFMGDLGSLSIGAFLAAASIQLGSVWSLLMLGLVFVIETMSDILQVSYHHLTGKRIFKMAPLHHHLELSGWSEEKINYTSYILTIILGLFYIVLLIKG